MTSTLTPVHYDITALEMTIYFNREGDHDHNGLMYALTANVPILRYIKALASLESPKDVTDLPPTLVAQAKARATAIQVELPTTSTDARKPHPLVRPLVLRTRAQESMKVRLRNEIKSRAVGLHLVGGGYDVRQHDGADVGANPSSLVVPNTSRTYEWQCEEEGVFPFHDGGNYSGDEDGTNVHGLFGALVVEPPGTTWRDPVTGRSSHGSAGTGPFVQLDGLYLDVLPDGMSPDEIPASTTTLEDHDWGTPEPYVNYHERAHREFVIFFHDEPEFASAHTCPEPNPCDEHHSKPCQHGEVSAKANAPHEMEKLPIMPISYRAEPMINRERTLWKLLRTGHVLKRPVLNEEQHHSSWMFGIP